MPPIASTGTSSESIYLNAEGEQVHPCRCGQTHAGPYAFEDWLHHKCYHRAELVDMSTLVGDEDARSWVMCPDCGVCWTVEKRSAG